MAGRVGRVGRVGRAGRIGQQLKRGEEGSEVIEISGKKILLMFMFVMRKAKRKILSRNIARIANATKRTTTVQAKAAVNIASP